jgi:hypothetical protein
LSVLFLVALLGCGQEGATVTGTVRYKGEAVPAGTVAFYGPNDQIATGLINQDGTYKAVKVLLGPVRVAVSTPAARSARKERAIQKLRKGQASPPAANMVGVPPKYSDPSKSGLELTVTKGTQTYEIDLKGDGVLRK